MANNGFTFIPNQPITFDLETDSCNSFLDAGRCVEYKRDDDIEFQIKREPCGDNLSCLELEEETLGDELLINSHFEDGSGWTVDPPFLLFGGLCSDGSGFGYGLQTISILEPGNYTFYFEFNLTAGLLSVEGSPAVPGTLISSFGNSYTDTGTSVIAIDVIAQEPGDYTVSFAGATFDGCVTLASFRQRLSCYNGAGWYKSGLGYQHLPGYNLGLVAYDDVFTVGKYYKVVLSVETVTDGQLNIIVGSTASESITGNITSKAFYINSGTSTGFALLPTSEFDGFVTIEQIYELTEASYIWLVDMEGNEVLDLSPFVTYVSDRINVKFNFNDASGPLIHLLNGCFRIAVRGICNPANANLVWNPEFLGGTVSDVEGWDRYYGSYQYDFSAGCKFMYQDSVGWITAPAAWNFVQPLIIPGTYEVTVVISDNSDTDNIGMYVKMDQSYETSPITFRSDPGTYTFTINYNTPPSESPFGQPRVIVVTNFELLGVKTEGHITIESVHVRRVENNETLATSNCIQIKTDAELACHKWVEGYGGCYGYGFDFRQFKLGMRVPILKDGPDYPVDQNVYLQSDGNRKRTKGERDKVYRVVTDRISEIEHDALSTMLLCDNFLIDDVPYFFSGKQYQPQWPRNRRSSIAKVELELTKDAVIMASDCGSCDPAPTFLPCALFCETAIGLKSHFSMPTGIPGWYMVDGSGLLEYSNGTTYSGTTKSCNGYVRSDDYYGATLYTGVWRFNSVTSDWEPIIQITGISDETPSPGMTTITAKVLTGCIGRIQVSADLENWTNITGYNSSAQLLAGVSFVKPVSFYFRLEMKCSICLYTSTEITIYS
jgi:hypothetical protein